MVLRVVYTTCRLDNYEVKSGMKCAETMEDVFIFEIGGLIAVFVLS